jgi:hypothetical protein
MVDQFVLFDQLLILMLKDYLDLQQLMYAKSLKINFIIKQK